MSPSPPLVLESLGLRQQNPEKYFVILTCRKSQRKWEEKQVLNKMKGGNIKELCLPLELEEFKSSITHPHPHDEQCHQLNFVVLVPKNLIFIGPRSDHSLP